MHTAVRHDRRSLPAAHLRRFLCVAFLLACTFSVPVRAQVSDKILKVSAIPSAPGSPVEVQVDLLRSGLLEKIEVAYRGFGERDYRRSEMSLAGTRATGTIPAMSQTTIALEYYFLLYPPGGAAPETYPKENPTEHPLSLTLLQPPPDTRLLVILSPEINEQLRPEDVLISFTIPEGDSSIDRVRTKIYVDGADLSPQVVRSGDLFVIKPHELASLASGGTHSIRVEIFDTAGQSRSSFTWPFSVTSLALEKPTVPAAWSQHYTVQMETRNENISSEATPYNRATITGRGSYNQFKLNGRLYLTNEEKESRQPQDRFYIGGESPWLTVGYGDSYPVFTDLIMNGRRVRGVSGSLRLGTFSLDVSHGDITRRIESDTLKTFPIDSLAVEQGRDPGAAFGSYSDLRWAKFRYGTFDRNVTVIRPSFGRREESHIAFTYLKSTDDISSIRYGFRPQENLVFGTDALVTLDRRNIEFTAQAAMSATNRDITNGTFSDDDIDRLYPDSSFSGNARKNIRRTRDILSRFITVNENLVPLAMKNFPTLSYEAGLALNYFDNALKFNYLRRGSAYESFGEPYVRTDVAGFTLADRARLAQNRVLVVAGVERLNDNTTFSKATTTTSTTGSLGLSYFPRTNLPTVTLAYLLAANTNDRDHADTLFAVDDMTNRVMLQLGKEYTFGIRHSASMGVSVSLRDDHTVRNLDTRNVTASLSNTSVFRIPLETTLGLSFTSSSFVSFDTTGRVTPSMAYATVNAGAVYRLAQDKLLLNGSFSPTFGDIQRILVNASVQYAIMKQVRLQGELSLYFNRKLYFVSGTSTDVIWSIMLNADI
jgi:hypothetical protein